MKSWALGPVESIEQESLSWWMTSLSIIWGSVSGVDDEQLWRDRRRTLMDKESQEQGNGQL